MTNSEKIEVLNDIMKGLWKTEWGPIPEFYMNRNQMNIAEAFLFCESDAPIDLSHEFTTDTPKLIRLVMSRLKNAATQMLDLAEDMAGSMGYEGKKPICKNCVHFNICNYRYGARPRLINAVKMLNDTTSKLSPDLEDDVDKFMAAHCGNYVEATDGKD